MATRKKNFPSLHPRAGEQQLPHFHLHHLVWECGKYCSSSTRRNLEQTFLPVVSWSVHLPQWVPSLTIGEILNKGIPPVFLASTLEFPQHILAKGVVCGITVMIFALCTNMTRQRFVKSARMVRLQSTAVSPCRPHDSAFSLHGKQQKHPKVCHKGWPYSAFPNPCWQYQMLDCAAGVHTRPS